MDKTKAVLLILVPMVSTIVLMDLLFFKNHFAARLLANIGIVLLYLAFYLRFLKE